MSFTYPPDEYLRQLKEYYAIEAMSFSADDSRETFLARLEEQSERKREIAEIANTIIREYIDAFEKDPGSLTPQDAEKLEAMGADLSDPKTGRDLDLGIQLRIFKLLKDHYRRTGRTHDYYRMLKECVQSDRVLAYNFTDVSCESPYIGECTEWAERFDELSEEDRLLLFSTLYWLYLDHEDDRRKAGKPHPVERLIEADTFLTDRLGEKYGDYLKQSDPLGTARNSLSEILEHFLWTARHGMKPDVERFRPQLERYTAVLRKELESAKSNRLSLLLSAQSTLLHADYHLGRISIETFLDSLTELQNEGNENESPAVLATRLGKITYHYLIFMYRYSGYDREKIIELSQRRIREVFPRILRITREVNNARFNMYLVLFILGASLTSRFEDFSHLILELTVYSDKALYVHTEMVKEISLVLFDHLIETDPEAFDGVAGRNADYFRTHKPEMRDLLSECCMFHDIGKFFMLGIVENSMRRLTDEEFAIIRTHPGGFEEFGRDWMEQDENLHCIRDCALTHHLWHDGTKGYPDVRHTNNRPFVDILSVADSLDAATDRYGRPYRSCKSLDELVQEFQSGSGTRYGPEAVAAISDRSVQEKLRHLITEGRKDIYCRAFSGRRAEEIRS